MKNADQTYVVSSQRPLKDVVETFELDYPRRIVKYAGVRKADGAIVIRFVTPKEYAGRRQWQWTSSRI